MPDRHCRCGTHLTLICGIDEVGRGAWAGPVLAAAVCLPADFALRYPHCVIGDSKKIAPAVREASAAVILRAAYVGIGAADSEEIDRIGLGPATYVAMERALAALGIRPDHILIDGKTLPPALRRTGISVRAVVGGDGSEASIGAASIVAKVCRDAALRVLDVRYPGYAFARHVGYGTALHRDSLARLGITPIHRRSFAPIRSLGQ